jgi:hypothetical protein
MLGIIGRWGRNCDETGSGPASISRVSWCHCAAPGLHALVNSDDQQEKRDEEHRDTPAEQNTPEPPSMLPCRQSSSPSSAPRPGPRDRTEQGQANEHNGER